ncbi:MAG: transglycosylase domain-containing protein [Bacteroidota bacterium]
MFKKLIKLLLKLFVLILILIGLFFGSIYYGVFGHLYSKDELKGFKNESASLVYSEDKELIGKFFDENRTNISYDQLPKSVINALVATEDARFFEHGGVDTQSLIRVMIKTLILQQKSSGGGSTISQQLAKNMYGRSDYGPLSMPVNKTKEMILANRLEEIYNKNEVLAMYLNTVPFGENVFGIESASRRYFNKSAENLKTEEAAVLIGMLKANTFYNPRRYPENALNRRNIVLGQMYKYDYLTGKETDSLQSLTLEMDYANLESEGPANYFMVQVKDEMDEILKEIQGGIDLDYDLETSGLIIETTLNAKLQNYALQAYKSHLGKMQKKLQRRYNTSWGRKYLKNLTKDRLKELNLTETDKKQMRELFSWNGFFMDSISVRDSLKYDLTLLHAGFLALDPKSGAVRSWVGGIDHRTHPYDQIYAQRQIASTFKPVLYAAALENGTLPCDYLSNDSIVFTDYDNWTPQNYNKSIGGNYSVAASLAKSMNIPTVNLFLQTPFDILENTWKSLGFSQELTNSPASALGTANASIYELAIAYSAFANGGKKIEPQIIRSVKTSDGKILYENKFVQSDKEVVTGENCRMMNEMLQKVMREGTGSSMKNIYGVNLPLAGKTGTSQDYADAWFAAYNPNLVIVTRVGASMPSVHFAGGSNGAGSTLAMPLVAKTLQKVQNNTRLKTEYFTDFPESPEASGAFFGCNDFVDDSDFEKFFEGIFKKHEITTDKASKKAKRKTKKKKSFFKRIFGKKE